MKIFVLAFVSCLSSVAFAQYNQPGGVDGSGNLIAAGVVTTGGSGSISLPSGVTGVMAIANGGTNNSATLSNNRIIVSSSSAMGEAAAITASRVLISDSNGIPVHSSITSTTLGYLDATSSIQTQLNAKASTLAAAYTNGASGTDSIMLLTTTGGPLLIRNNSTPIATTIFGVQNSAGTSKYIDVLGTGLLTIMSGQSTANAVHLTLDCSTRPGLNSAGKMVSFRSGSGGEQGFISEEGTNGIGIWGSNSVGYNTASGFNVALHGRQITMDARGADGASFVGGIIDTDNAISTSGGKLFSFRNHTTEKTFIDLSGNVATAVAGAGFKVKEGTNARMGVCTLVLGTCTVSNTSVGSTTRIFLTEQTNSGVLGTPSVSTRTNGTSFVITSTSATDTSDVAWLLIEPSP